MGTEGHSGEMFALTVGRKGCCSCERAHGRVWGSQPLWSLLNASHSLHPARVRLGSYQRGPHHLLGHRASGEGSGRANMIPSTIILQQNLLCGAAPGARAAESG